MERIVLPVIATYGYTFVNNNIIHKQLVFFERIFWGIGDGLNVLFFHLKEKGLIKGMLYFFNLHRIGSWRR